MILIGGVPGRLVPCATVFGVRPADFATGGSEPSPLANDLPSLPDRAAAQWLWVLLPPLIGTGTTQATDQGGYALLSPSEGAWTQDYRSLVMPSSGAPVVEESTIDVAVGATISGASAGAVNLFPASTGSALVSGASAASVVLTGAGAGVTGDLPISGASAQVFSLSASGAGQILVRGLSASTFSLIPQSTGSAGSSPVAGDSAAVFLLTGAGAGTIDESVGVITASPSQSRRSGRHINRPGRQTF